MELKHIRAVREGLEGRGTGGELFGRGGGLERRGAGGELKGLGAGREGSWRGPEW